VTLLLLLLSCPLCWRARFTAVDRAAVSVDSAVDRWNAGGWSDAVE